MRPSRIIANQESVWGRLMIAAGLVLLVIFSVPMIVYGIASAVGWLNLPEGASPAEFLLGVAISKAGTALTFVGLFFIARSIWRERWWLYAALWWLLFFFGEVGQAVGPGYSWQEAVAGILSEAIYIPVSAWITHRLLRNH